MVVPVLPKTLQCTASLTPHVGKILTVVTDLRTQSAEALTHVTHLAVRTDVLLVGLKTRLLVSHRSLKRSVLVGYTRLHKHLSILIGGVVVHALIHALSSELLLDVIVIRLILRLRTKL